MSQRQVKSNSYGVHVDSIGCDKYMNKLVNREKHLTQLLSAAARGREKMKYPSNDYRDIKPRPNVRQQNVIPSHTKNPSGGNSIQYSDDSALVEVTVKTLNPTRQRSRSTTDKESWSQMLKDHKNGDRISSFGNFDPLRTLHFLSKELQLNLNSLLPNNNKIQQMVSDMQYALRRVPPEVASQVHLLQGIEALQKKSKSQEKVETIDCGVQSLPTKELEDTERLQKLMTEGTLKLESSCRQMEKLCTDLKNEKNELQEELSKAFQKIQFLNKKLNDLEVENNEILNPRINSLEEEKRKLTSQLKSLSAKFDNQSDQTMNDLKSQVAELRSQKNSLDHECNRLRHQIKVSALEREKFVAILTLRDTQINEIRTEMSQLQELVNQQLMELHTNAFQGVPIQDNANDINPLCLDPKTKHQDNNRKNDVGSNDTLGTILTNEDRPPATEKQDVSFKDLQSGDIDIANLPGLENMMKSFPSLEQKNPEQIQFLDKLDSHASIKAMFNEIKKTADAVARSQRSNSRYN